jgi:ribonuclease-3
VRFKDLSLLERALTHRSASTDGGACHNERLEFLGDSVVGLIVSEDLYRQNPGYTEGDLAKSKAYIVSEAVLADAAREIGLEEFLVLSAGEAATGGRKRRSILADAFEAVMAAVFLDRGIVQSRRLVRRLLKPATRDVASDCHRRDYKSALQERTQAQERTTPIYRILQEAGTEHDKTFTAQVFLGTRLLGAGDGKTKKEAEQAAARDALARLPS